MFSIRFPARRTLAAALSSAALTFAACGEDESSSTPEPEEAAVSPEMAVAEIDEVRSGLDEALAAYRKGDADAAEQLAGDAYLEHFELVEGPLEERDEELNEELEELIREELRAAIVDGAPASEVETLVETANSDLDEATAVLQGSPPE